MANLVAVLATTHHPFFYRASTAPQGSRPDFADEWVRKVEAYRETLTIFTSSSQTRGGQWKSIKEKVRD